MNNFTHNDKNIIILSSYIIGEYGKLNDMSSYFDKLMQVLENLVHSTDLRVGEAASYCMGSIASNNLSVYLPRIIELIQLSEPLKKQVF